MTVHIAVLQRYNHSAYNGDEYNNYYAYDDDDEYDAYA